MNPIRSRTFPEFRRFSLHYPSGDWKSQLAWMSREFEKRCEARQSKARAESVLEHVTKRVAAITPPRALVVLRFLLNKPKNTLCFRSKLTTCFHPNSYTRSAETGEIFGLLPLMGNGKAN